MLWIPEVSAFFHRKTVAFKASKIQYFKLDGLTYYSNIYLLYNICTKLSTFFASMEKMLNCSPIHKRICLAVGQQL